MQSIKGLVVAAIIIAIVIVGGIFFFAKQNPNNSNGTPTPTEVAAQQADNATVITLTKTGFTPNNLTVKAGTTVKWVNNSGAVGQVDSDPHPTHTSYPPMNFQPFSNGSSVELVFDKPGTYKYHNHLNPSQTGTVTVQ